MKLLLARLVIMQFTLCIQNSDLAHWKSLLGTFHPIICWNQLNSQKSYKTSLMALMGGAVCNS